MPDRLMLVGDAFAWWAAGLPVEVDGGAEGEDASGDAGEEAQECLGQVAFEGELLLERLHDRFDPLADEADRRLRPLALVGSGGAQDDRSEFACDLFELTPGGAGVTVVAGRNGVVVFDLTGADTATSALIVRNADYGCFRRVPYHAEPVVRSEPTRWCDAGPGGATRKR